MSSLNEIFKYKIKPSVEKKSSLAGSVISAYTNDVDLNNNITELVGILNGKDITRKSSRKKPDLGIINENLYLSPDDSVSNIGNNSHIPDTKDFDMMLDNVLKNTNITESVPEPLRIEQPLQITENNIDSDINRIKNIVKPESNLIQSNNNITTRDVKPESTRSIFEDFDINSLKATNIPSVRPLKTGSAEIKGGSISDVNNNLMLAIIVIFMFCSIGFTQFCDFFNNKTIIFILLVVTVGLFYYKK